MAIQDIAEGDPLSQREVELLSLLAKGMTQKDACEVLEISHRTLSAHMKSIYKRLGVHNLAEAIYEAFQIGIFKVITEDKK